MSLEDKRVAVTFTGLKEYPPNVPFHPAERYPEYPGEGVDPANLLYGGVRETLHRLGLDRNNFGTPAWNPLGGIVEPGMTVLIKPNMVRHRHLKRGDIRSVIVHASVLRPILDYVCLALKNKGRVIVGDSPQIFASFGETMATSGTGALLSWYRSQTDVAIESLDLRSTRGVRTWLYGRWGRKPVEADPRGYQWVDLAGQSCFRDIDPKRLRVSIAGHRDMYAHHSGGRHEYLFPGSVLESDVIINVPKMKTHRRTAVTLALKNFMGLPAAKESLPHCMTGAPEEGGDQYIHPSRRKRICTELHDRIQSSPSVPEKFLCAVIKKALWNTHRIVPFKDDIYDAMWYGNDTLWRTLLDINRAALYADKAGVLRTVPQRGYFCLIDGVIGGEREGPSSPDVVRPGVLMAGFNPIALDAVASTLMGFDIERIPSVSKGFEDANHTMPLYSGTKEDIQVLCDSGVTGLAGFAAQENLGFEPHPNWKGHVERA